MSKFSVLVLSQPELALVKVQNRMEGAIAPQRVDFELVRDAAGTLTEILVCFPEDANPEQVQGAVRALVELSERDPALSSNAAPGVGGGSFSKTAGFEDPPDTDGDAPAGFTSVRTISTAEEPRTGAQHARLDSGAAAGDAALAFIPTKSVGSEISALEWIFWIKFPSLFTTNNNSVTGTGNLQLDFRLNGLVSGKSAVFRYSVEHRDSGGGPASTWFAVDPNAGEAQPTGAATDASEILLDGAYHRVRIRFIPSAGHQYLIGFQIDSEIEFVFDFYEDIVVPTKVEVRHNWDAPLDRAFDIDDWSLTYSLAGPAQT